ALDDALEVDVIGNLLCSRQNLTGKLYFAAPQSSTTARVAFPCQEKAYQLPHGARAEAARHYRLIRKRTIEEPEIRRDIQFGDYFAFTEFAAGLADVYDAIKHQHIRVGQLGIARAE